MRRSRGLVIALLLAVGAGSGVVAAGPPVRPSEAPGRASPQEAEGQVAAEVEQEGDEGDGQESRPDIDPATLPMLDIATTDEQEQALRLVETILAEQSLLLSGQNFVYQAGGRRDPFRSLLAARRREIEAPALRPPGLAGFLVNEIKILATASYQGRWQAMVVGLDQRSYFVEVGAALYDGRIVEISGNEVIFEQEVEDLLGARSTRRISKRLAPGNQE